MSGNREPTSVREAAEPDRVRSSGRPGAVATLYSSDLFAGSREVIIEHQGDQYRLRCTSKGKLILTK